MSDVEERLSRLESTVSSLLGSVDNLTTSLLTVAVELLRLSTGGRALDARALDPDREVTLRDGSKIKVKDIPVDPRTGMPEESWAEEYCPCPEHEAKRKLKSTPGPGQYL